MKPRRGIIGLWTVATILWFAGPTCLPGQTVATLQCLYDDLGQLVQVIDAAGNVATYAYDLDGNILAVTRTTLSSTTLLAVSVTPQVGSGGQNAMILGQGFSTTPANNVVKFNGAQATVVSASPSALVVTIPAGATTGPVSVTVGGSTAQGPVFTVTVVLVSIAISPGNPSLPIGEQQQLAAIGTFSDGSTQDVGSTVTWSSSANNVAPVSATGVAFAKALGTATITGQSITSSSGVVSGSTSFTVTPVALVSLSVLPANFTVATGRQFACTAQGNYSDGSTRDLTTQSAWVSTDTATATISNVSGSIGFVTTLMAGTTTIQATFGSMMGSTLLTVTTPTTGSLSAPRFSLVANTDATISVFAVTAITGQLRPLGFANNPGGQNAAGTVAAIDPVAPYVYVTGPRAFKLNGYSMDANSGALTPLASSPFPGPSAPSGIAIDHAGKFVFVADQTNGVYVYSIGTGGALTPASNSPFHAGATPSSLAVHPQGTFVYVANHDSNNVSGFAVNSTTGVLTPVTGSPFATGVGPGPVAIDPTGTYLYAANENDSTVSAFTIDSTSGVLTVIAGSPYPTADFPFAMAAEPSGQFLYVACVVSSVSGFNGSISAFTIGSSTGALAAIPGSPFVAGHSPTSLAADPSGQFLYVANQSTVGGYTINPVTGALVPARTYRARGNPTSIAISGGAAVPAFAPKFAYIANSADGTLSGDTVDASTGSLAVVMNSPFHTGADPVWAATDTAGQFAYAANQTDGNISAYTIDSASGELTPITGSPFPAGSKPSSVAVDPSGRFAYAANQMSGNVSAYTVSSGALTPITGSPFSADTGSVSVTVDPLGKFAYVANKTAGDVSTFVIDPVAGTLTNLDGAATVKNAPAAVAVDPTGNYVYVANSGSNNISAFSISDPFGGGLSAIFGSPFAAGTTPSSLTVDRSGKYLYAANAGSNNVSAYSIAPASGALTPLAGSPFAAGTTPSFVAVDTSGAWLYVVNSGSNNVSVFSINIASGALAPLANSPFAVGSAPLSIAIAGSVH